MTVQMEFHALGPLRVLRDGEIVDLGPHKQKSLFALLLIHANDVVPTDRILDQIWGDDGPDRKNALRVYASRLRSALEPNRVRGDPSILETREAGYRLAVDVERYDVARFEHVVNEGRTALDSDPKDAAEKLRQALDLWRGSAFDEFVYDDFAQVERTRLAELRIGACEDRIQADLACGLSGELVSEIEVLRAEHPLRERLVGQQMLALYRSGRPADALRAMARFRRAVGDELGLDPSPVLLRLEEQVLLHDHGIQLRVPAGRAAMTRSSDAVNPYKGLRPFGVEDVDTFFGRDALVAGILRAMGSGQRLVALLGASGSGKSSVVRAGVIPALAKGALPQSGEWLVASMMPGAHPFAELEAALLRSTINAPDSLREQFHDEQTGLLRAVLRILPDHASRLVLVIDQFEELFTMVEDEAVRAKFLTNLVTALDDPHDRISVVLTLRADFYGQPLSHPEFGARLGDGIINVTAMTAGELEAAALQPAQHVGVAFEPALLGQLISDVGTQPGALPLFQYALTELFDRRVGDTLMMSTYRSMGGSQGALQRRAGELYDQMDESQQEATRQLFLRLVSVSEHDQRSRRRVEAREIASVDVDTATMHDVIRELGAHRLLSFDSDRLTGAPTVELAHEALLTSWPVLEAWIDESRDDLRRHSVLTMAMREWQLADHDPRYLLNSARLVEYDGRSGASTIKLNQAEREFLDAGSVRVAAEQADEDLRRQGETRARRRLWGLVAVLVASLGLAGLFLAGVFTPDPGPTVTFFGDRSDQGWNAGIASGLDRAARDLHMQLEEFTPIMEPAAAFREFARTNPEIVITDSVLVLFAPEVFAEFPEIRFGIVDPAASPVTDLANVTYVSLAYEEGAFLAGAAAAAKTETGVIGFIGGTTIPTIEEFRAGYEAGARAVNPDVQVLATFIDQFGDMNGFGNRALGEARADALYARGADVVFAAAGLSGFGLFDAAEAQSNAGGRHLWAIGVDDDQWFDVEPNQRTHVLTSIIKRGDVASFMLAAHMIGGGPSGEALRLGLADGGFDFSTQGDGLTDEMAGMLDQYTIDIAEGRIIVPTLPSGPVLLLDDEGNEIAEPERQAFVSTDGLTEFAPVDPGTYVIKALGTPITVTLQGDWWVQENTPGLLALSHPDSFRPGDRDVVFLRPNVLADPAHPQADIGTQEVWPVSQLSGLDGFDEWLAGLIDGIIVTEPERVEIGGRQAIYFEAEITDRSVCGGFGYCAGFVVSTAAQQYGLGGWSFDFGFHQRVWWVDGGTEAPVVIIASTPSDDRGFGAQADALIAATSIGEPAPHPSPSDDPLSLG